MWDFLTKLLELFTAKWQAQIEGLTTSIQQLKELIMGFKEDFATFQSAVQAKFDELQASLTEINNDIKALMTANAATPPEVVQGMQDIQNKLQGLVDAAKADAALNDSPTTPAEPPL